MLALVSAALLAASSITAAPLAHSAPSVVQYLGMEDITPAPAPGTGYVLRGEAMLITSSKTIMYDLAGRKSNGDLTYAAPRPGAGKPWRWNWYSTGMFNTVTWF